jgi:hypothetical protein
MPLQALQHIIFFVNYKRAQKAGVFVLGRLFQPSLVLTNEAAAYPSEVLTLKHETRLEKPATSKHSSLLCPYLENKVM